jgi:hypothetical protein
VKRWRPLSPGALAKKRRRRPHPASSWREDSDAKLTDLLAALADCPKARWVSIHDRYKATFGRRLP